MANGWKRGAVRRREQRVFRVTDYREVGTLVKGNGFVWCPTQRTWSDAQTGSDYCRKQPAVPVAIVAHRRPRLASIANNVTCGKRLPACVSANEFFEVRSNSFPYIRMQLPRA